MENEISDEKCSIVSRNAEQEMIWPGPSRVNLAGRFFFRTKTFDDTDATVGQKAADARIRIGC
jgi:hypothetical protein